MEPIQPYSISQLAVHALNDLRLYLSVIEPVTYQTPLALLSGSTIGQHSRHIIEFYNCLLLQSADVQDPIISYAKRERDFLIESQPDHAIRCVNEISEKLNDLDTSMACRLDCDEHGQEGLIIKSTIARELIYNIEHTIHHLAIVKIALKEILPALQLPEHFWCCSFHHPPSTRGMCTVTFIPFKDTFFITSNRDETPERKAKGLISLHPPGKNVIHYPLDESSGGSWIALSDSGRVVCILNGAFETFIPEPSYKQSRGQVVIDAAHETDIQHFLDHYDLEGIAPFTLLLFENDLFVQLIWDGEKKHVTPLSITTPQIWSSVTLYRPNIRAWRKSLFEKWLRETSEFNRETIIQFHQIANGDPDNDFIMNRNEIVKTLSITNIELKPKSSSILHFELDNSLREEILVKYE